MYVLQFPIINNPESFTGFLPTIFLFCHVICTASGIVVII